MMKAAGSGGRRSFKLTRWGCTQRSSCKKIPCQVANFLLLRNFHCLWAGRRVVFFSNQ